MENIESQEEAGRTPSGNGRRVVRCIKEVLPIATRTALWIIKITVGVSLAILFLKYFNILPLFSDFISPVFNYLGLPGEAALAYVTGYFRPYSYREVKSDRSIWYIDVLPEEKSLLPSLSP